MMKKLLVSKSFQRIFKLYRNSGISFQMKSECLPFICNAHKKMVDKYHDTVNRVRTITSMKEVYAQ